MHTFTIGQSKKFRSAALFAAGVVLTTLISTAVISYPAHARHHSPGQYLVPPPPPTPVLSMPPPPVMLPYAYAMQTPSSAAISPTVTAAVGQQISMRNNAPASAKHLGRWQAANEALSITVAKARGFGAPRGRSVAYTAGGAQALPYSATQTSPTWFDQSLRWYSNYQNARGYYSALSQDSAGSVNSLAPNAVAASSPDPIRHHRGQHYRHSRRVIASR